MMESLFTADFYKENRQRLMALLPHDAIVIVPSNGLLQRTGDTHYPFRQDSTFLYLTGITEPCATLVINGKTGEEWVMVERREGVHAIFDGVIDDNKLIKQSGITTIISDKQGWQLLKSYKIKHWYAPINISSKITSMYTNPHRTRVVQKLKRTCGASIKALQPLVAQLRVIKQPQELQAMQRAIVITNNAVRQIQQTIADYSTEQAVVAQLNSLFLQGGAGGHAFDPIVASAAASCTLHYIDNNQPIQNNNVLLLDIGAEYQHYAADVSRTLFVGDERNTRKHNVMQAVAAAQQEIIGCIQPGMSWKQLSDIATTSVAKQLVALKLIDSPNDSAAVRQYFPHAVSHFMGLDVHDVGDYSAPLKEGMVITVEPGIYIQQEAFGVRIEDDILITRSGAKVLGDSLPSLL